MGMFPKKSCISSPYAVPDSAPNPDNFKLVREWVTTRDWSSLVKDLRLVVEVHYPDAKNFEGRKVMVYAGVSSFAAIVEKNLGRLDPHFADHKYAPIARFPPTQEGWDRACSFAVKDCN
jgi:hypothetical protein